MNKTKFDDMNLKNRSLFCKNPIDVLRAIYSECIDWTYLESPFHKKKKMPAP